DRAFRPADFPKEGPALVFAAELFDEVDQTGFVLDFLGDFFHGRRPYAAKEDEGERPAHGTSDPQAVPPRRCAESEGSRPREGRTWPETRVNEGLIFMPSLYRRSYLESSK